MTTEEATFDVQVEPSAGTQESTICPPSNWTTDHYVVSHLSVEVHTNPSTKVCGFPILTFHDIGQNSSTFTSICTHSRRASAELDAAPAHYHITAPGHQPRAPDAPSDADFSLHGLTNAVLAVLDRFSLTRVVAIGVGAGANAFLRAAGERPRAFAGLILISPDLHASHLGERVAGSVSGALSRGLGLAVSRHTKEALLSRWLSTETHEQMGPAAAIEENLDKLNPRNVSRFIAAESWRGGVMDIIKKVDAKVLFITGKESSLRHHTADIYPKFDPVKTSWLDVHECGSLVHEEMPERVVQAVTLFLQGLPGYC